MGFDRFTGHAAQPSAPELTGRYLVLCRDKDASVPGTLKAKAGLTIASSADFQHGAVTAEGLAGADGVYFDQLGVAVTSSRPDQMGPLVAAAGSSGIMTVEPERVLYILGSIPRRALPTAMLPPRAPDLSWRGSGSIEIAGCAMPRTGVPGISVSAVDEALRTWGLAVSGAGNSSMTGRGVRVAILDTGLDLQHPDFAGRRIVSQTFVKGTKTAQDGQSHGTHCVGIALGPRQPENQPRYGVAPDAEIFIGKVMRDDGRGVDGDILAGMNWALANKVHVISMSLGTDVPVDQAYSEVYETVARRALAANTLIVAAAGNASHRPDSTSPVGHPANCPSILAVGAVNSDLLIAPFSSCNMGGGEGAVVDIAGPGVDIFSTVPLPGRYGKKSGTSMACPHVAGIAALYYQANPNSSAKDIWQLIVRNAKYLDRQSQDDVGAGLVQAPV